MLSSVVDSVGLWSTSLTYYIIHAILVASATYWFVKRRDSAKQQSYKLTEKVVEFIFLQKMIGQFAAKG